MPITKKDETIIPRKNQILVTNSQLYNWVKDLNLGGIQAKNSLIKSLDLESSCLARQNTINQNIDDYIQYLSNELDGGEYFSPYFGQMAFYLSNKTATQLINTFDEYLRSINYTFNASKPIAKFTDSFHSNYTFNFRFESQNDVQYALNSIKIYKLLLSEFVEKNERVLNQHSEQYFYFFFTFLRLFLWNEIKISKTYQDTTAFSM